MIKINIARTLSAKRREKGVTQDELAAYIGVSKASVSKWETAQSYPDITFLPQLATYFNISIDDLMGYEPQLGKDDIRKLYHSLSADLTDLPFDEAINNVRDVIKKYYSCFPLLFQMGILILNYSSTQPPEYQSNLYNEALSLFRRIRVECDDAVLCSRVLYMSALCHSGLSEPNEVLGLLGNNSRELHDDSALLCSAYIMTEQPQKASETIQVGIYQMLFVLISNLLTFAALEAQNHDKCKEIIERATKLCDMFEVEHLNIGVALSANLMAAQSYLQWDDTEQTLVLLQRYVNLACSNIYPLKLKGDSFFNLVDNWLSQLDLGSSAPRTDKAVKQSIIDSIEKNAVFDCLSDTMEFKSLIQKLHTNIGG